MRKPPTWLRAYGTAANPFLSFLPEAAADTIQEGYLAYVLAAFAASVASLDRSSARLVEYDTVGVDACLAIAAHFGLTARRDAEIHARAQLQVYSKDPSRSLPFTGDVAEKRAEASPRLREAITEITLPGFEQLRTDWNAR
jgi:hypothetical protein